MPRIKSLNGYENQIMADLYCTTQGKQHMWLYPLRDQNQTIETLYNTFLIVNRLPVVNRAVDNPWEFEFIVQNIIDF